MERDITKLFREKKYHELDSREKEELSELAESEEEFERMRSLFEGIELMKNEEFIPKAQTKSSLDSLFADVHENRKKVIWYNSVLTILYPSDKPIQRRPIVQIAAAAIVLLMMIPFFNSTKIVNDKTQVAKVLKPEIKPIEKNTQEKIKSVESIPAAKSEAETTIETRTMIVVQPTDKDVSSMPSSAGMIVRADLSDEKNTDLKGLDFDHPDGIFEGSVATFSRSAKQQPGVLDLLTAAF